MRNHIPDDYCSLCLIEDTYLWECTAHLEVDCLWLNVIEMANGKLFIEYIPAKSIGNLILLPKSKLMTSVNKNWMGVIPFLALYSTDLFLFDFGALGNRFFFTK